MLSRIFPTTIDNRFPGHRVGVWLFLAFTVMTLGRSLLHVFSADGAAQSIATIPLDSFGGSGAAAVVSVFAFWGPSQLLLGVVFVVVAARYKALIPLMYVLILAECLGRIGVGIMKPLPTVGVPPRAYGNLILIPMAVVGLVLSLRRSRTVVDPGGVDGSACQRGSLLPR